jgi:group I intron endonuclease
MVIYKALLKYGYANFSLEILEYCEPSKCVEREQYYLDLLKPEYNILPTAGSSFGFRHSEESKKKISSSFSHPPPHTCVGWGLGGTESFSPPPRHLFIWWGTKEGNFAGPFSSEGMKGNKNGENGLGRQRKDQMEQVAQVFR